MLKRLIYFSLNLLAMIYVFTANSVVHSEVKEIDVQNLEDKIYQKVYKALTVILTERDFIINIKIDKEIATEEARAKEKVQETSSKQGINLTDKAVAQKDYILFQKLGLEAPIVFEDIETPNQRVPASGVSREYERLTNVEISILLDNQLEATVRQSVRMIVNRLIFNIPVKPTVKFTNVKFQRPTLKPESKKDVATKEDLEKNNKEREPNSEKANPSAPQQQMMSPEEKQLDLLSKFSTSLGFVLATLILCGFILILFRKYSKFQAAQNQSVIDSQREIAETTAQAVPQDIVQDNSSHDSGPTPSMVMGTDKSANEAGESIEVTMDRFKSLLENNQMEATALLKKWINLKPSGYTEALVLLAQELDSDSLLKIFNSISIGDRKTWKAAITSSKGEINFRLGARFIDEQIIGEIIVPNDLISEKTKSLLYGIPPHSTAKLMQENQELAPLLMNTLSSGYIIKVMSYLDSQFISNLAGSSMEIDGEALKQQDSKLQEALSDYQDTAQGSPFSDKIVELLPHVGMDNEESFLEAYGKTVGREQMLSVLQVALPSKAIFDLPDNALKTIFNSMKQDQLIELLAISEESLKTRYLEIIAPDGSRKREVFDFELKAIENDEQRAESLKKKKKRVEVAFVELARTTISRNSALQEEVEPIFDELCTRYTGQKGSGVNAA